MRKRKYILDPLWITKGSFLDLEYCIYILLAANKKYKKEIEKGKIDHFYEVLFHTLNLNNLALEGKIFNFKMEPIHNNERISQIKNLKNIYNSPNREEIVEIFKNANYLFLNILLDYMEIQLDLLNKIELFYFSNNKIHLENEIFVILNKNLDKNYSIWSLSFNKNAEFRYSFNKIANIFLEKMEENILKQKIKELGIKELENMNADVNSCAIIYNGVNENKISTLSKDIILLNKGLLKDNNFEPNIISTLYNLIFDEKVMPFTLSQFI